MRSVGVRELKQKTGEILREVAGGSVVRVTHHGRVMADLVPPLAEERETARVSTTRWPVPVFGRGANLREVIERVGNLRVPEGFADQVEQLRASQDRLEEPRWPRS